jgi:hypothetical protein
MTDVIGRVNLVVNGQSASDALELQRRAAVWAQETLLPELERIILAQPTTEGTVCIDRLDIETDVAELNGWENALFERVRRQLPAELAQQMRAAGAGPPQGKPLATEDERAPGAGGIVDALRHYLRHGRLPWYQDSSSFEVETEAWVDRTSAEQLLREILPLLRPLDARRRLLRTLSSRALQRIADEAFALPSTRWSEWAADVQTLSSLFQAELKAATKQLVSLRVSAPQALPEALWLSLLGEIAAPETVQAKNDAQLGRAVSAFVQQCVAEARALGGKGVTTELAARSAASPAVIRSPEFTESIRSCFQRTEAALPARPQPPPRPAVQHNSNQSEPPSRDVTELDGQFITNAGLVLLGPYLRKYLERLGHAKEGRILDPAAALVAVQLLASGEARTLAEHELVLPKILCGFPLDEAPPPLPPVDAGTVGEATALLEAIIGHWSVLKKTSASGLREAFLQRGGKVSLTKKDTWLLQVEQKPYDMLLGQLPWSYSMIKLPWMERLLITEWVN